MTTPTPPIPTFTDGLVVHANALNALGSNIQNLYNDAMGGFVTAPPFCIANQTTVQSVPNTTYTSISFNTTLVNNTNMWVASQPTQLTVQVAGTYLVWAQILWAGNTAGYRGALICVNGAGPGFSISNNNIANNAGGFANTSQLALYKFSAGATIISQGWQNTGGLLSTATGGLLNSSLAALWLSN